MSRFFFTSFLLFLFLIQVLLLSQNNLVVNGFSARLSRPWYRKMGRMSPTTRTDRITSTESAKRLIRSLNEITQTLPTTATATATSTTTLTSKAADEEDKEDDDMSLSNEATNEPTAAKIPPSPLPTPSDESGPRFFIAPPHQDAESTSSSGAAGATSSPSSAIPVAALETVKLSIANDKQNQQQQQRQYSHPSIQKVNGAAYEPAPTVRSCLPDLYQMTRPSNFPGVVLFHMIGTYLALKHTTLAKITTVSYGSILLFQPLMWVTLLCLLLTDATSMLVNDYYDNKMGLDSNKAEHNRLVSGQVPMHIAKRFLSYLYAAALVCVAFVPGVPARLSILTALMFTFWYTQHLKPITWLKNVVCASLIALSPFTSGSAALALLTSASSVVSSPLEILLVGQLWRLVAMLFAAFLGREIMMDCNDVVDDRLHRVRTVPVKYGRKFASTVALACTGISAVVAMGGPLWEVWAFATADPILTTATNHATIRRWVWTNDWLRRSVLTNLLQNMLAAHGVRRLILASLGGLEQVRRAWHVYQTEGEKKDIVDRAVEEGKLTSLLLLASFI